VAKISKSLERGIFQKFLEDTKTVSAIDLFLKFPNISSAGRAGQPGQAEFWLAAGRLTSLVFKNPDSVFS
jgi:hypothetical protein